MKFSEDSIPGVYLGAIQHEKHWHPVIVCITVPKEGKTLEDRMSTHVDRTHAFDSREETEAYVRSCLAPTVEDITGGTPIDLAPHGNA